MLKLSFTLSTTTCDDDDDDDYYHCYYYYPLCRFNSVSLNSQVNSNVNQPHPALTVSRGHRHAHTGGGVRLVP